MHKLRYNSQCRSKHFWKANFILDRSLLVVGLGSGFIGGLLGVGGGIIIVPVLFLLFSESSRYPEDLVLLVAIATSLACIVFTSASAAYAQIKGRRVLWDIVKRLLPSVLLGSVLAGYLAPWFRLYGCGLDSQYLSPLWPR